MVPFQKGPCGEGGRMRGFLLPLLEAAVVVLVLLLILKFCDVLTVFLISFFLLGLLHTTPK